MVMRSFERKEVMKKFIILLSLLIVCAPVYAACQITGFCAPPNSVLAAPSLQEKYVPHNLNQLQKPDSFMPHYHQPYYDMLINTEEEVPAQNPQSSYNSNCQFGVCLPGSGADEEITP